MNLIIIGMIVIGLIAVTVCITIHIYGQESVSEWQVIKYTGSSVEPKSIYICKRCNNKSDINYHYCDNCGAMMNNGVARSYHTNGIQLDLDE